MELVVYFWIFCISLFYRPQEGASICYNPSLSTPKAGDQGELWTLSFTSVRRTWYGAVFSQRAINQAIKLKMKMSLPLSNRFKTVFLYVVSKATSGFSRYFSTSFRNNSTRSSEVFSRYFLYRRLKLFKRDIASSILENCA